MKTPFNGADENILYMALGNCVEGFGDYEIYAFLSSTPLTLLITRLASELDALGYELKPKHQANNPKQRLLPLRMRKPRKTKL